VAAAKKAKNAVLVAGTQQYLSKLDFLLISMHSAKGKQTCSCLKAQLKFVRFLCSATKHHIGSDISIKSLKRKTKHQRRLQFNQRVKRAF
jgi:hypothetical protein